MEVNSVSYAGNPIDGTAMFVAKKVEHLVDNLKGVTGCKVFVENGVIIPSEIQDKHEFIFSSSPQKEYAVFVQHLADTKRIANQSRKYTKAEEGYVVGENVSIGENCTIEPGCFIDHDVIIGDNAYLKTGCIIRNSVIGNNFIACENCTIGTNGFTMADDDNGNKIRIPTLGKVIIGNNVEIGALSNISCGLAGNTIIEDNVKIDSLVHIGHDAHLQKNVEITAGAIVAGFVDIGECTYVGINTTLRNRRSVGKHSFVGMGAVVTKNVDNDVTVVGNPAKPFQKYSNEI